MLQLRIDFSTASALGDDAFEFGLARRPNAHASAVVEEDVELFDIICGAACHLRMYAARIVADHSAQSAPGVRRGIRTKGEVIFLCGIPQVVANDAGLNASDPARRIDFDQVVHVFGKIEQDSHVAALAGETRAATSRKNGSAKGSAKRDRFLDILRIARNDHADRRLTVIGAIGRVESSTATIETNFAFDFPSEFGCERFRVDVCGHRGRFGRNERR